MLFTRCPDCDTTFRITADALGKADGQVRCGRCACVFNAYSELREQRNTAVDTQQQAGAAEVPEAATRDSDDAAAAGAASEDTGAGAQETEAGERSILDSAAAGPAIPAEGENVLMQSMAPLVPLPRPDASAHDPSFGDFTVANIIEQIESSALEDDADEQPGVSVRSATGDSDLFRGPLVDTALDHETGKPVPPSWRLIADDPKADGGSRRWLLGSMAAAALLALQLTHYFRAEIAGVALVGPLLQGTYALFGAEVVPHWHLEHYEIVDWVATAEPNASGQGSLKITARIQNKGPQPQPYPYVHVQLNDRWEEEIGNRIFDPAEYLTAPARSGSLMAPGTTARAELEVVDPGPDAYGFELDVCVQAEANTLRCSADAVFPSM